MNQSVRSRLHKPVAHGVNVVLDGGVRHIQEIVGGDGKDRPRPCDYHEGAAAGGAPDLADHYGGEDAGVVEEEGARAEGPAQGGAMVRGVVVWWLCVGKRCTYVPAIVSGAL